MVPRSSMRRNDLDHLDHLDHLDNSDHLDHLDHLVRRLTVCRRLASICIRTVAQIQPRKPILNHAECAGRTRQPELNHTTRSRTDPP